MGVALGARMGVLALGGYLVLGGAGLPVFADGASGWEHLSGPTSGYLFSFVVCAALIGWLADRGLIRRFLPALSAMGAGHAVILILGWARLGSQIGFGVAYNQGVAPFIVGGAAKSLIAAMAAVAVGRYRSAPRTRQVRA